MFLNANDSHVLTTSPLLTPQVRALWYTIHAALKDQQLQKKGMVLIFDDRFRETHTLPTMFDLKRDRMIIRSLRNVLPIKVKAFHHIIRKSDIYQNMLLPHFLYLIGQPWRLRYRQLNGDCMGQVVVTLSNYGISLDHLTGMVGGAAVQAYYSASTKDESVKIQDNASIENAVALMIQETISTEDVSVPVQDDASTEDRGVLVQQDNASTEGGAVQVQDNASAEDGAVQVQGNASTEGGVVQVQDSFKTEDQDVQAQEDSAKSDDDDTIKQNDLSNDTEREQKLAKNRVAARERRKRKRVLIEDLKSSIAKLTKQNQEIQEANLGIRGQIQQLSAAITSQLAAQPVFSLGNTGTQMLNAALAQELAQRQLNTRSLHLQQCQLQQQSQAAALTMALRIQGPSRANNSTVFSDQDLQSNLGEQAAKKTKYL